MQMSMTIHKYPRTKHIEGSCVQPGDEDLDRVPVSDLAGRRLVIEEKVDGANVGVSFDKDGELFLQSRGHFLAGGPRERQYSLLKTWVSCHQSALWKRLGGRYVMYGEWMYAKHTVFYDLLPHYFLEFDILDRETGIFLDTPARRALIDGLPVVSVPVLAEGTTMDYPDISALVGPSLWKSDRWKDRLHFHAVNHGLDVNLVFRGTDMSDLAEGLYIKAEVGGAVTARAKWVRTDFRTQIVDSGSHWMNRPIIPNRLAPDVDIYAVN